MKKIGLLSRPPGERGSITPIIALGLLAFVGFLAIGIDLGQLYVVRNELQNVADGAALAAAKQLIREDPANPGVAKVFCSDARTAAVKCAEDNHSLGLGDSSIVVTAQDVIIGKWDPQAKTFTAAGSGCPSDPNLANAVQVTVRRTGEEGSNPQVTTFFSSVIGAGSSHSAAANATAYLSLAGTSSVDPPFAVPYYWVAGQGPVSSNFLYRILDKFGPAPAYAADPQQYTWYDKGGTTLPTDRATWALTQKDKNDGQISAGRLWDYLEGDKIVPQVSVGDKLYPLSEYYYGWYNLQNFTKLQARYNAKKNASGKWRVTVPVYKTTPVTASLPQNSWFRLASRFLPGVSPAYACTAYSTPVVYVQGFITMDITGVTVNTSCIQTNGSTQTTNPNSCRNQLKMDVQVPQNQNTVSSDQSSGPGTYYPRDYPTMNPDNSSSVGVFASTPKIVK
jgi:Flp pilus assembly protein TadG